MPIQPDKAPSSYQKMFFFQAMKNHDELQKRAVEGKPVECVCALWRIQERSCIFQIFPCGFGFIGVTGGNLLDHLCKCAGKMIYPAKKSAGRCCIAEGNIDKLQKQNS